MSVDSENMASRAPEPKLAPESFVKVVTSGDFDEKVLKSTGKVLVDFNAIWCGPCRMLAPVLEQIAQEHKDEVTILSCNVDDCRDIAMRYSIMNVPSMLLFENGEYSRTAVGAIPKEQVEAFIGL